MADCCRSFWRVVLGIFTGLFLVIGLLMLGFGIALKVDPSGIFKLASQIDPTFGNQLAYALKDITSGAGVFMIVLGSVTVFISFFGFAGAVTGSPAMLIIYAVMMFLILGAEIALIVLVAAFPEKITGKYAPITNYTKEDVSLPYQNYAALPTDTNGLSWYLIQNYFGCCGFLSAADYDSTDVKSRRLNISSTSNHKALSTTDLLVPVSCCKKNVSNAWTFNSTDDLQDFGGCIARKVTAYNTEGCAKKVIADNAQIPIAIAATTLGIEVFLIICAIAIAATAGSHSKL